MAWADGRSEAGAGGGRWLGGRVREGRRARPRSDARASFPRNGRPASPPEPPPPPARLPYAVRLAARAHPPGCPRSERPPTAPRARRARSSPPPDTAPGRLRPCPRPPPGSRADPVPGPPGNRALLRLRLRPRQTPTPCPDCQARSGCSVRALPLATHTHFLLSLNWSTDPGGRRRRRKEEGRRRRGRAREEGSREAVPPGPSWKAFLGSRPPRRASQCGSRLARAAPGLGRLCRALRTPTAPAPSAEPAGAAVTAAPGRRRAAGAGGRRCVLRPPPTCGCRPAGRGEAGKWRSLPASAHRPGSAAAAPAEVAGGGPAEPRTRSLRRRRWRPRLPRCACVLRGDAPQPLLCFPFLFLKRHSVRNSRVTSDPGAVLENKILYTVGSNWGREGIGTGAQRHRGRFTGEAVRKVTRDRNLNPEKRKEAAQVSSSLSIGSNFSCLCFFGGCWWFLFF
ncbi:uncharacterized protein LOC116269998 [Papio anubis]|uniref:uncharacterized protein LOC116269998 n=1 Tax=Papio anubis TaxID=9555 RepID=UPI0012AE23F9|nr:uncharacterized protein LOC116269998 [Papio anubis]